MTYQSARYSALNQSTQHWYGTGSGSDQAPSKAPSPTAPGRYRSRRRIAVFSGLALIAVSTPVLGATQGPPPYSTQETTRRLDGAGDERDIRPLEPGPS